MNLGRSTLALVLTLDRDLLIALAVSNLGFSICAAVLLFRRRAAVDRVFITLGVFLVVMSASLWGLHAVAGMPVREAQVLVFD